MTDQSPEWSNFRDVTRETYEAWLYGDHAGRKVERLLHTIGEPPCEHIVVDGELAAVAQMWASDGYHGEPDPRPEAERTAWFRNHCRMRADLAPQ